MSPLITIANAVSAYGSWAIVLGLAGYGVWALAAPQEAPEPEPMRIVCDKPYDWADDPWGGIN